MHVDRAKIFQAVKVLRKGQGFTLAEVQVLDAAIDEAFADKLEATPPPASPFQPNAASRLINQRGIDLIKEFEGCEKPTGDGRFQSYLCPAGVWTIGFGSTGPDIKRGLIWTKAQVDERFERDINEFAGSVEKALGNATTTANQLAAMTALAYNIGLGGFRGSSVLRLHKAGDYKGAGRAFLLWNKAKVKGKMTVLKGLTRRRLAEADLYDD
jgi:GH24 family phage-related lysozyme (muramidase)